MLQLTLLLAGIVSSLVYINIDLMSAARYPGYSLIDMAISELSAVGAPAESARLWRIRGPAYGVLFLGFAIAVLRAGRENWHLRQSGWTMLVFVVWNMLWPLFPMHQRDAAKDASDIVHLVVGGGSLLLMLIFIGFGSHALGARFRRFSLATLAAVGLAGIGTFLYVPAMGAGGATPWLGVVERVMIYGYLVWIAALGGALMWRTPLTAAQPA